jgi:hypothetical protein
MHDMHCRFEGVGLETSELRKPSLKFKFLKGVRKEHKRRWSCIIVNWYTKKKIVVRKKVVVVGLGFPY